MAAAMNFRRKMRIQGLDLVLDGDYYEQPPEVVQTENGPLTVFEFHSHSAQFRHVGGGRFWGTFFNGELVAYCIGGRWYKTLHSGETLMKENVRVEWFVEEVPQVEEGNQMHFRSNFGRISQEYHDYRTAEAQGQRPWLALDASNHSDLAVFSEVLLKRCYEAAIGADRRIVTFVDREDCTRGGSSRSTVLDVAPESRTQGQAVSTYDVQQISFDEILTDNHTVVKMDIEGSEIPILERTWDWKNVRLLMVEISVVSLRRQHGTDSWKKFADILDNLRQAGFALAKIEARFWKLAYFDPKTKDRSCLSDGIVWFARLPGHEVRMLSAADGDALSAYTAWWNYRAVMEAGGRAEKPGAKRKR